MSRTTLRAKGQITIPDDVRRSAHLEEGDLLDVEITPDGILLRPQKLVDATQAWFWKPDWQEGEREVEVDLSAAAMTEFASGAELLASLAAIAKPTER